MRILPEDMEGGGLQEREAFTSEYGMFLRNFDILNLFLFCRICDNDDSTVKIYRSKCVQILSSFNLSFLKLISAF